MVHIVCISDTHTYHRGLSVPEGDLLLCAGDITANGDIYDVLTFAEWIKELPHRHKVVVAGNHDFCFERNPEKSEKILRDAGIVYLKDEAVELCGLKIYGSPWQPEFCNWAFNLPRGPKLKEVWDKVPDDTDVLITHGPPYGILDEVLYGGDNVGCEMLLPRVKQVKPLLHLFGHIHETYGVHEEDGTTFVNASICDVRYNPDNLPLSFFVDKESKTVIQML